MKFILLDDSWEERERTAAMLRQAFEGAGVERVSSRAGLEAALERADLDLVITEHRFGWGDGLQVLALVRERLPGVPVLMFTASDNVSLAVAGMKAGLSDYVLKQNPARLVPAVREVLLQSGQQDRATVEGQDQFESWNYRMIQMGMEATRVGWVEWDWISGQTWWSEHGKRILGFESEEESLTAEGWFRRIHPEDRPAVEAHAAQAAAEHCALHHEYRIIHPDGTVRHLLGTGRIFHDENDRPVRSAGWIVDVTERKRGEEELRALAGQLEARVAERTMELTQTNEALRESAERYARLAVQAQAVLDSMTEGLIIADLHGNILEMNPAALRIHDLADKAEVRHHLQEFTKRFDLHHLNGRFVSLEEWPMARALRGEAFADYEVLVHNRETGRTWVGSYGGTPVRDAQGQPFLAIVTLRDVTEHRRAEVALEQRNRDLQLLNRLGQELGASLELDDVLGRVLAAAREVVPAEGRAVWLRDEDRPDTLVCQAADWTDPAGNWVGLRLRLGESAAGWVAQHGETAMVELAAGEDPRFAITVHLGSSPPHVRLVLAVPLRLREQVVGVLELLNPSHAQFRPQDRELLETLSAAAAIALENARLHGRAREAVALQERNRLARELHDAVSQALFAASVISEALPRLWERKPERVQPGLVQLHTLVQTAMAEMRALLLELRPTALLRSDLGDLLQQLGRTAAGRSQTRLAVQVQVQEVHRDLPVEVKLALYRIAQEALSNTAKHARARQTTVSLDRGPDGRVVLEVSDDGRGFDPDGVPPGRMGLNIMRERAEAVGACLEIDSGAGRGTRVRVACPVEPRECVAEEAEGGPVR